ncbi:MAG: FecR domain-containing protein [Opitutaceae bacterium]|nr:FecR domain-containing protein [Opitutaceae bacterium]
MSGSFEREFSATSGGESAGSDLAMAEAAAAWIVRQDRGLSGSEARELAAWKLADPQHAAEFVRLGGTWRSMDELATADDLAAMADAVVRQARRQRSRVRLVRLTSIGVATAAAVVLTFLGWSGFAPPVGTTVVEVPKVSYRVLASTLQRMTLPDGSVAELNGASRIEVAFTAGERRVRLVDGEAHFIVAKNPERPFFVTAGTVAVRAVGTAFNVRLGSDSIEVLVTEGKVQLEPERRVEATGGADIAPAEESAAVAPAVIEGQRAIIARAVTGDGVVARVTPVTIAQVGKAEIEAAMSWQATRLVFNNTPLDDVVAAFNRHHPHRLTIGDPILRQRTLTGVFRADNLEGFIRLLKASVDVRAEERTPIETVLLPLH